MLYCVPVIFYHGSLVSRPGEEAIISVSLCAYATAANGTAVAGSDAEMKDVSGLR